MRDVLIGAVEVTTTALEAMVEAGYPPEAVFCLDAKRSARHSDYTDVGARAGQFGIPVVDIVNINDDATLGRLAEYAPDHVFIIGWSQICSDEFLALPKRGCIGFHPAALPRNRGRAVIPWTITQRAAETGSTLFWLGRGVDDGDILRQTTFRVDPDETARSLYDKHGHALRSLLASALPGLAQGEAPRVPQDDRLATYCAKRTPRDGHIDWNTSAETVWTLIRAASEPYPGAFTFSAGRKLVVWEADLVPKAPYWGLPGQVVSIDSGGALVQAGDRAFVRLRRIGLDGSEAKPKDLSLHAKLGIDLVDHYLAIRGSRS